MVYVKHKNFAICVNVSVLGDRAGQNTNSRFARGGQAFYEISQADTVFSNIRLWRLLCLSAGDVGGQETAD